MLAKINTLFSKLIETYESISSTSTSKYLKIRDLLAETLILEPEGIYITGAKKRISNLDTRLAQGNQRNQHTPLGVAFINISSKGKTRDETIEAARSSFTTTVRKFVSGEERGTIFDGVLGFIQIDDEDVVAPLVFLYSQNCTFAEKVKDTIPEFNHHSQLINKIAAPGVVANVISSTAPNPANQAVSAVLDTSLVTLCSSALSNAGMKVPEGVLPV